METISSSALEHLPHEQKWLYPVHLATAVQAFLAGVLRPDPVHPVGRVTSVYFDTPGLDSLAEKQASDYLKTKIRVRWYDGAGTAFWEIKRRIGSRREKLRGDLALPAATAAGLDLDDPRWLAVPAELRQLGLPLVPDLRPSIEIRYRRRRFVDPATGARVALDDGILRGRTAARLSWLSGEALPWAVVEVKHPRAELGGPLYALAALGGRRVSFSKYGAVCAALEA
ncbi:MAG: polyphosphate polymerase domain-containing protein [Thermoanaerobaculia bacterium]|nr:polyphosphate polymerase domain-containing protein [Thermoanaerobaculia bacterium]